MPRELSPIIGYRSGKLVVRQDWGPCGADRIVVCDCDCGKSGVHRVWSSIVEGRVTSCMRPGCAVRDPARRERIRKITGVRLDPPKPEVSPRRKKIVRKPRKASDDHRHRSRQHADELPMGLKWARKGWRGAA